MISEYGKPRLPDGGPENRVQKLPYIRKKLARKEIRFANTMVEVFFKTLKSQYLSYQSLASEKEHIEALEFFIEQYNDVIPRKSLGGFTPGEVLSGQSENFAIEFVTSKRKTRESENRMIACTKCAG